METESVQTYNIVGPGAVDWEGLEQKFYELKGYLSEPSLSFSNSSAQRSKQRQNVELGLEAIIEVALSQSNVLLQDGDFRGALEKGLKTLQFVQEMYGANSIEQIEPYFLLAKANQYLKRYKQAEEFLSIANWTIIKNPQTPPHVRAELHQNFGLLYVGKGHIDKSIDHLATSVYYLAILHGADHLITSFGYFNLGNVFASQGKMDAATDFLRQVTSIWHSHLLEVVHQEHSFHKPLDDDDDPNHHDSDSIKENRQINALEDLDEDKIHEAGRMFEQILHIQMDRYGENHIESGKIFLVLGLYQWYTGELIKSRDCLEKSASIMQRVLGDNHLLTLEVRSIMSQIVPEP
mmetsp:Transcript_10767/g.15758  ORF Transcript_10767/g.15758 Transcript_10767/m.15758 type:complete len:349 (+) Transcript_10767:88-1134(+)|eukprot:CAMPEP_0117427768 /NCGR_PEP_ID=MMETSP0758-20121206/7576_1 /TAXON_ID=63605 /ORGANISM="Percolomonas cosmopolitus, Strain AE-1 (ATCC 50343)" /LENGTH=348 /DNA_ID=CAMNT_0005213655 /DNA_START=32 /DNA_END=1078 /DNA_ORIENTATION=+